MGLDENGELVDDRRGRWLLVWGEALRIARSHWTLRSLWLRNSLRGALGLALAVGLIELTDIQHGFWVVLGALSVLRSNAAGTGITTVKAVVGTFVGFVVGAILLILLANHLVLLWVLLPIAVFLSGFAPVVLSFTAGQAAFTFVVLILFNILVPEGWTIGITRLEDVAIGAGVSLVVGLVLWPRGARSAIARALADAYQAAAVYLGAAIDRATAVGQASSADQALEESEPAFRRLEDAFSQYVQERGAKPVPVQTVVDLTVGAQRTRVAGYSLALLPAIGSGGHERLASMDAARNQLIDCCDAIASWFVQLADALTRRQAQIPPITEHGDRLKPAMLAAFQDARRARRSPELRATLRMFWADETLDDEVVLQRDLARAARQFDPDLSVPPDTPTARDDAVLDRASR